MDPKEKAKELIDLHLKAQIGGSLAPNMMLYVAKQCAKVTVSVLLKSRVGYPYAVDLGIMISGLQENIDLPEQYWRDVRNEIDNYENNGCIVESDPVRITCLTCSRTSYNVNDVENRFCGHCNKFH